MWENFWLKSIKVFTHTHTHIWLWVASVMSFSLKQTKKRKHVKCIRQMISITSSIHFMSPNQMHTHTHTPNSRNSINYAPCDVRQKHNSVVLFFIRDNLSRTRKMCTKNDNNKKMSIVSHAHTRVRRSRCSQTTFAYYSRSHTRAETIMGSLREKKKNGT